MSVKVHLANKLYVYLKDTCYSITVIFLQFILNLNLSFVCYKKANSLSHLHSTTLNSISSWSRQWSVLLNSNCVQGTKSKTTTYTASCVEILFSLLDCKTTHICIGQEQVNRWSNTSSGARMKMERVGAFYSTQNSRNFGWYIKWNGPFWFGPAEIFGTSFEGGPLWPV